MKREMISSLALSGALLAGCANTPASPETATPPKVLASAQASALPTPSKYSGQESGSSSNTVPFNDGGSFFLALASPMTAHEKTVLSNSFLEVENYWAQKDPKLVGITAIRLVMLSHDANFNCPAADGSPRDIEASDVGGTQFCQSLGRIVFTEGLVSYVQTSPAALHTDTVLEFFVDHEFGHAVQASEGTLKYGQRTTPALEQQADCDAGLAFKALDPRHVQAIESFLPELPPGDSRHGSPQQRAISFEKGIAGGPC